MDEYKVDKLNGKACRKNNFLLLKRKYVDNDNLEPSR